MVKFLFLFLLFFCVQVFCARDSGDEGDSNEGHKVWQFLCTIIVFARLGIFSDIFSIANCTVNFKNSDFLFPHRFLAPILSPLKH